MPSLNRIRRAFTLPARPSTSTTTTASSSSTDLPSSPTSSSASHSKQNSITELPSMMLTKTTSGLSRIKTGITLDKEEKYRRKVEEWRRRDEMEWEKPGKEARDRRSRKWSKETGEALRGWEWSCEEARVSLEGGRSGSIFSGISPCTTRVAAAA